MLSKTEKVYLPDVIDDNFSLPDIKTIQILLSEGYVILYVDHFIENLTQKKGLIFILQKDDTLKNPLVNFNLNE